MASLRSDTPYDQDFAYFHTTPIHLLRITITDSFPLSKQDTDSLTAADFISQCVSVVAVVESASTGTSSTGGLVLTSIPSRLTGRKSSGVACMKKKEVREERNKQAETPEKRNLRR
jgi:hypothetical protein